MTSPPINGCASSAKSYGMRSMTFCCWVGYCQTAQVLSGLIKRKGGNCSLIKERCSMRRSMSFCFSRFFFLGWTSFGPMIWTRYRPTGLCRFWNGSRWFMIPMNISRKYPKYSTNLRSKRSGNSSRRNASGALAWCSLLALQLPICSQRLITSMRYSP